MMWIASRQSTYSPSADASACSVTSVPYQPTLDTELEQRLLQRLSSAMQSTHHRAYRDVEDLGDLFVGETFHVSQQHGHPELLGQRLHRLFDIGLGEVVEHLFLGAATGRGRLQPAQAAVEIQVLDVVELGLFGPALAGAVGVDERVGEDPVQPRLQVGAGLE